MPMTKAQIAERIIENITAMETEARRTATPDKKIERYSHAVIAWLQFDSAGFTTDPETPTNDTGANDQ